MCANMEIYNKVRAVPKEAVKTIQAGRLKGKSDINPMWRIRMLTEIFGVCGFGWKITIDDRWIEQGYGVEAIANVKISLYVREPETKEWSDAIVGIGGAMFISQEKNGVYNDDDAFKKAYTDAISIACKALGFCADIYYSNDPTKYSDENHGDMGVDINGLPFPDVPPYAPNLPPPPSPLNIGEKALMRPVGENVSLGDWREWAVKVTAPCGKWAGQTLGDIRKKDIEEYNRLKMTAPTPDVKEAITIIDAWIGGSKE